MGQVHLFRFFQIGNNCDSIIAWQVLIDVGKEELFIGDDYDLSKVRFFSEKLLKRVMADWGTYPKNNQDDGPFSGAAVFLGEDGFSIKRDDNNNPRLACVRSPYKRMFEGLVLNGTGYNVEICVVFDENSQIENKPRLAEYRVDGKLIKNVCIDRLFSNLDRERVEIVSTWPVFDYRQKPTSRRWVWMSPIKNWIKNWMKNRAKS